MRTRSKKYKNQPLPPHFVVYDYDNPSPLFSADDISYIESIRRDFNKDDLARIHQIETWILNTNTGWLNSPAIPGLRPKITRGHRYVKRFSADPFAKMITTFLDHVRPAFDTAGLPCNMPLVRVTLPNEDKYYAISFHDDLEKWVRVLDEAAAFFNTKLGRFDRGKFVVSDGEVYPFSSIGVDKPENVPPPKAW